MGSSVLVAVIYLCFVIGVIIYVLILLSRFVSAHEHMSNAVEHVARAIEKVTINFPNDGK